MIKKQIIKKDNKPIAIVIDFQEYKRLKEIEEDRFDYFKALKIKLENKKWTTHKDLKKLLKL
jgi:hypothetical protein